MGLTANTLAKVALTIGLYIYPSNTSEQKIPPSQEKKLFSLLQPQTQTIPSTTILFSNDTTVCNTEAFLENIEKETAHNVSITIKRPLNELTKNHPLTNGIRKNLGELLGYNQVDSIIANYPQTRDSLNAYSKYLLSDTLSFPLIYPELKEAFPKNLLEQLQEKGFHPENNTSSKMTNATSVIVIKAITGGKQALALYRNGQLVLATYVSVGKGKSTIRGNFPIGAHLRNGYSHTYNVPMPYALGFHQKAGNWKYLLHQGKVEGTPLSHGCVRVPGLYQEILFYSTQDGDSIIIDEKLYEEK